MISNRYYFFVQFNSRREEFKNVTAEALNRYCQTMSCSTVDGMSAKKRAISDNLRQFIKRLVYHLIL